MAETKKAGRGALIVILVIEAMLAIGAVGVGFLTGEWLPVIIVIALAGAISAIAFSRLQQAGK